MTAATMSAFRCWSAEKVGRTVFSDIGALSGDADAVFLAAHTPIQLEHRKGPELSANGSGEDQVLAALTSRVGDLERNTLVAVTGASGSGKSHVVRWVHSHLLTDDPSYHVLYVPRAIQTLRELLRRIIDGLPGVEGSELMKRVDEAISSVKPGELQARLVNEIKLALDWTLEDRAPFDGETLSEAAIREDRNSMLGDKDPETGGRQDGLADLLELPQFQDALLRPEGRLSLLVQSYFDERSRRDDSEIFTPADLPLKERGIRAALSGRRNLADLWELVTRNPEDALALLEEALRVALPKTVGLRSAGGETLDSLFRASRKALRKQGRDLVLVFEDLAQFGLVDGELYDQFVTPPGDELAPLRVLFAITDGPYQRLERTVRTRVEHEFHVGGSALSDPEAFVGRYLNLVRIGREKTQNLWRSRVAKQPGGFWMANACNTIEQGQPCRFRDMCHDAFGVVTIDGLGDIGLYPFNHVALRRAITHLGDNPTPRDVLDTCVSTVLMEADVHIEAGDYPHERTRQQFDFKVRMAKDALQTAHPSPDPERTYRALVIWGDELPLPVGLLTAFSLDGTPASPRPTPLVAGPKVDKERKALPNPLQPLFQWQAGGELPEGDVTYYRDTLRRLTLDRLQLDEYLTHIHSGRGKEILDRLFNVTSFAIEGARGRQAGPQSLRFSITRGAEDVQVLAASRWFREHGHFDSTQARIEWPQGYDPAQLAVQLEARLDKWAAEVRTAFLSLTGGSRIAEQAVGLRAIALAASGRKPDDIATTTAVLRHPVDHPATASSAWAEVDDLALSVIATIKADDYVGEFAAVRQGDSGSPQLIDPQPLDAAIRFFLENPLDALNAVTKSEADPVLAQAAQRLQAKLISAAPNEAVAASKSNATVHDLLEGQSPGSVGKQAEEVGQLAKDAGVFRPADKYMEFRAATAIVSGLAAAAELPMKGSEVGAVLQAQHAARETYRLAASLRLIQQVMEATNRECKRVGAGGDVLKIRKEVRALVAELAQLANSLGGRSNS